MRYDARMGKLEQEAKARRSARAVEQTILAVVGAAGVLSLALVAPKALDLLKYTPLNKYKFAYRTRTTAGRMVAMGYLKWVERDGKKFLRLTPSGYNALQLEKEKAALAAQKKRRWDRLWRMVVFDVPERRRKVRGRLCAALQEVGFVRLQDSVWVYPYDCEDFIALLKAELKIGKDVLYAIADTIEHDKGIRRHFSLLEA